jgi:prepilin peptidase CpaA
VSPTAISRQRPPLPLEAVGLTQAAADVLVSGMVCTAAWWDVKEGRLPNAITVTGLAAAFILRAPLGVESLLQGVGGFALAFGISVVLYALRAIGGGDVKLLAAVGAFLGSAEIMGALALIAVLGAGYALLSLSWRGLLPLLVFNTLELVKGWLTLGRGGAIRKLESPGALSIPYGIPIALGTLFWWFGKGVRL